MDTVSFEEIKDRASKYKVPELSHLFFAIDYFVRQDHTIEVMLQGQWKDRKKLSFLDEFISHGDFIVFESDNIYISYKKGGII